VETFSRRPVKLLNPVQIVMAILNEMCTGFVHGTILTPVNRGVPYKSLLFLQFSFSLPQLLLFVWKAMGLEPGDADDPNHDAQHDSAHAEQSKLRRGVASVVKTEEIAPVPGLLLGRLSDHAVQHDLSLQLLALLYKILNDICPLVGLLLEAVDVVLHVPDLVQGDLDVLAFKGVHAVGVLNQVLRVFVELRSFHWTGVVVKSVDEDCRKTLLNLEFSF